MTTHDPKFLVFAIERAITYYEIHAANVDKANPADPYASLMVREDIDLLREAASTLSPKGASVPQQPQDFEDWWQAHGQFCRAGGGNYEKTFAFRSWQAAQITEGAKIIEALGRLVRWAHAQCGDIAYSGDHPIAVAEAVLSAQSNGAAQDSSNAEEVAVSRPSPVAAPPSQWVSVEDRMPEPGLTVLATYQNRLGKTRRICAQWIPARHEESNHEYCDCDEYDEATDTYYLEEGWYERIDNWDDYSRVFVNEGEVEFWQDLPPAPLSAGIARHERRSTEAR